MATVDTNYHVHDPESVADRWTHVGTSQLGDEVYITRNLAYFCFTHEPRRDAGYLLCYEVQTHLDKHHSNRRFQAAVEVLRQWPL